MRAVTAIAVVVLSFIGLTPDAGAIPAIDLLSDPEEWAGSEVTIRGELVGDFGFHAGAVWIQLNDDPYADEPLLETELLQGGNTGIALRGSEEVMGAVLSAGKPGGYRQRGPIVEATGTFVYHDPERSGETYVLVETITVLETGRPLPSEAAGPWGLIGTILVIIAAIGHLGFGVQRYRERTLED